LFAGGLAVSGNGRPWPTSPGSSPRARRATESCSTRHWIIRYHGKIEAVVNNAQRARELAKRESSQPSAGVTKRAASSGQNLRRRRPLRSRSPCPTTRLEVSSGPTTIYAFMQAMGLVNDHVEDYVLRAKVECPRKRFERPER
jgi:DNA-3-methyladenine glycosylase I